MTRPTLSIIILNYNTKDLLKNCLQSIFKNDQRLDFSQKPISPKNEEKIPAELIIVDNNSVDSSREYLQKIKKKGIRIILNKKNLGFAKGNNQGIEIAQGEYILLLNSDTIVNEAAISQSLFWLSSHPEAAIVGCKLLNPDRTPQPSAGAFPDLWTVFLMLFKEHFGGSERVRKSGQKIEPADWLMGAFLLARKHVFDQIGGLDENIFMYYEEIEWFYRAKKAGFQAYFYPNAKITHLGGASSSRRTEPILNNYRGLIYFYQKHKPLPERLVLKLMLKTKAFLAYTLGLITNNHYLKETYGKAFKLV